MADQTHYNIHIIVTKVEHKAAERQKYQNEPSGKPERIVTDAGEVKIKNTDFAEAKRLAGAHLELLTEFTGTDPTHKGSR
jgi:hypothetical protein